MKRPGLLRRVGLRRKTPLENQGTLRRRRRKVSKVERRLQGSWILALHLRHAGEDGFARCAVTGKTEVEAAERLEGHHVIEREHLRQRFPNGHGDRTLEDLLWDQRNGMLVTSTVHRRHTTRHESIPFDCVPAEALEFARELDLEWYLAGRYTQGGN